MKMLYEIKVAQQKANVDMDVGIAQVNFATGLLAARVDKLEAEKEFANWANQELLEQTRELIEISQHLREPFPLRTFSSRWSCQADRFQPRIL